MNFAFSYEVSSSPSTSPRSASPHSPSPQSANPHDASTYPISPLITNTLSVSTAPPSSGDKKQLLSHRASGFLVRLPTIDEYSDSSDQQEERVNQSTSPVSLTSNKPDEGKVVVVEEEGQEAGPMSIALGVLPSTQDRMSIQSDDSVYSTPQGSLTSLNSTTGTIAMETTV